MSAAIPVTSVNLTVAVAISPTIAVGIRKPLKASISSNDLSVEIPVFSETSNIALVNCPVVFPASPILNDKFFMAVLWANTAFVVSIILAVEKIAAIGAAKPATIPFSLPRVFVHIFELSVIFF